MRFVVTLRDGSPAGSQTEVLVDAEPQSPFPGLMPQLLASIDDGTHPSFAAGVQVWVDGVPIESPEQHTVASAGLRPGAIVELHAAHERPASQPAGIAEIRVVNGPGAGRVHRLALGHTVLGYDAPGMALADGQLPAHALTVIATAGGGVEVEPVPGVAATLDGAEITSRQPWPRGACLVTGRTVLELAPVAPAFGIRPAGEFTLPVLRPPRPPITPPGGVPGPDGRVRNPDGVPGQDEGAPGPDGVPGQDQGVPGPPGRRQAPVLRGPITQPGQNQTEPITGQDRRTAHPARRWLSAAGRSLRPTGPGSSGTTGIGTADGLQSGQPPPSVLEQARAARRAVPDPASLLLSAVALDAAVWQRFPGDDDFLRVRLGLGARGGLPDVPVWTSLTSAGVLGIAGDPETAHGLAAWLMAQCAVLQSPRQVRLAVLTTNQYQARRRWEWLLRVPHSDPGGISTADDDPEPPVCALVGTDEESIDQRLAELSALIADRQLISGSSARGTPLPRIVVLADGARRLRGRPGLSELLADGPGAGVYTICVDDDENWLPPECRDVVVCGPGEATLRMDGSSLRPDQVEPIWTDQLSRLLSPLRDASRLGDLERPQDDGLLALLGLASGQDPHGQDPHEQDPDEQVRAIEAAWRGSPSGRVVIGAGHDGPFAVDLRFDGPHLLVAGDPQSRPGALLTVMIASLAAANRPDHLNVILISSQAGSDLMACAGLPHVCGVAGPEVPAHGHADDREEPGQRLHRVLSGLSAELDRRDALLSQAGARDLDDYAARGHRLPRLLVAIEDVVELTGRPGGCAGLVQAAQRGESLGLHLLMATSRPQDIASHEIASLLSANASLRICLRVGSESASRAIIDAAEASRIPIRSHGRGYARTGHWPLLAFQAPRLGPGPAPSAQRGQNGESGQLSQLSQPGQLSSGPGGPRAWALPWDDAGHPAPVRPVATTSPDPGKAASPLARELAELSAAAQSAAQALSIPPPEPPWLPPLPPVVTSAALRSQLRPATVELADPVGLGHPWALEEHLDRKARAVASIELGRSGHLLIAGAPGTGRSTALRTIAGVLAERVSAADLHIYALDCGDGALTCLDDLPHTGALVRRSERARAGLVLSQLVEEVAARHETLAAHSWPDVHAQRTAAGSDERLPYLLLVIDRWETLTTGADGQTLAEQVLVLLRRGAEAGLQVVIGGDGSLLRGPVSAMGLPALLLCPSEDDYRLAGHDPARWPAELPAGRGIWAASGVQVQVSVLSPDAAGSAQAAAIEDIAKRRARRNASIPDALRPVRL